MCNPSFTWRCSTGRAGGATLSPPNGALAADAAIWLGRRDWPGDGPGHRPEGAGMADRMLFIGWGEVVRGREDRASAVFDEVVGFYGRCQQEGRIERFDVAFLENHASDLTGFFALHGTA